MDDPELKGWELKGARFYTKGLILLAAVNVLFLISSKPVTTEVFLWLNGIALGMFALGAYLTRHIPK